MQWEFEVTSHISPASRNRKVNVFILLSSLSIYAALVLSLAIVPLRMNTSFQFHEHNQYNPLQPRPENHGPDDSRCVRLIGTIPHRKPISEWPHHNLWKILCIEKKDIVNFNKRGCLVDHRCVYQSWIPKSRGESTVTCGKVRHSALRIKSFQSLVRK